MSSIVNIPNFSSGGSKGITKVERKTFISELGDIIQQTNDCNTLNSIIFSVTGHGRLLEIIALESMGGTISYGSTIISIDGESLSSEILFCTQDKTNTGTKILTNIKENGISPYSITILQNQISLSFYYKDYGHPIYRTGNSYFQNKYDLYGYIPDGIPFNNEVNIRMTSKTAKNASRLLIVYELYS